MEYPRALHTVLDTTDARGLAEFYRQFLGLRYRPGDEGTAASDWLVLVDDDGRRVLAFQETEEVPPSTWPEPGVPMQLHVDYTVPDRETLEHHRARALELGATVRLDRTGEEDEPLYVFADPAGHPFCVLVG